MECTWHSEDGHEFVCAVVEDSHSRLGRERVRERCAQQQPLVLCRSFVVYVRFAYALFMYIPALLLTRRPQTSGLLVSSALPLLSLLRQLC